MTTHDHHRLRIRSAIHTITDPDSTAIQRFLACIALLFALSMQAIKRLNPFSS